MTHVALLGDSVFDNAAYVGGGPDVATQVKSSAGGLEVTLLARDGATIADIGSQARGLDPATTHVVVSIGGNDALRASGVLEEPASSVAAALAKLSEVREKFSRDFSNMVAGLTGTGVGTRPIAVAFCTIYEPRFPPERRRLASAALCLLNDAITREVFANGFTLIDLRLVCNEDDDFANPIEPSVKGGSKIARAITRFVTDDPPTACVFANS
jgi:lysophospholipase L1-like esterase